MTTDKLADRTTDKTSITFGHFVFPTQYLLTKILSIELKKMENRNKNIFGSTYKSVKIDSKLTKNYRANEIFRYWQFFI